MSMAVIIAILVGLPLLYIAIDVGLAINGREGDTYSEIIRRAFMKFRALLIFISFGFGLLSGHFFWCPECEKTGEAAQARSAEGNLAIPR